MCKKILFTFITIFLFFFSVEIILQSAGKFYTYIQHQNKNITKNDKKEIRILCVGESTTALGWNASYPKVLERMLQKEIPQKKVIVFNQGVPGTNTTLIAERLPGLLKEFKPHITIFMMGINDSWSLQKENKATKINLFLTYLRKSKIYKFLNIIKINYPALLPQKKKVISQKGPADGENYQQGKHLERRGELEKSLKYYLVVKSDNEVNLSISRVYIKQGKLDKAIIYLKKFANTNPNFQKYIEASQYLFQNSGGEIKNLFERAPAIEKFLKESIKLNPFNHEAYYMLGEVYFHKDETKIKAKYYLEKSLEFRADNNLSRIRLAQLNIYQNNIKKAEEILQEGIKMSEKNFHDALNIVLWSELIHLYINNKLMIKAHDTLSLALKRYPNGDWISLYSFLKASMKDKFKLPSLEATDRISSIYLNPITINNYLKIVTMAINHPTIPIIMQYPNIKLRPLKKIFTLNKQPLIFVDNEENFKQALKNHQFEDLFNDRFAEKFGHFTLKGSQVISNQIIKTILSNDTFHHLIK